MGNDEVVDCYTCGRLVDPDEVVVVLDCGIYKWLCPDCFARDIAAIYKLEPGPSKEGVI